MNIGHESNSDILTLQSRITELEGMVRHLMTLATLTLPNIQWILSPEALNELERKALLAAQVIVPEYTLDNE